MRKSNMIILGIIVLVFISGCTQKEQLKLRPDVLTPREPLPVGTSGIFAACRNFALGEQLGYEITTDNQAFDILRQYWYACPLDHMVEDCIPEDMTGDEAIGREFDPQFDYTSLTLENGQEIEAWVLNWNYALDQSGNVYGCYFEQ